jgi:hypothetical protein
MSVYFFKADLSCVHIVTVGNVMVSMWICDVYSIGLGFFVPSMESRVVLVLNMFCFQ